ncbi:MAG: aminotransferase class I/II-fold pyridoxal phosphate-dependent enzyme [Magnetococcales bacterium]|nr:aminotransferase class I/II-fold pyridoxal phosphate-dependent enzyme [Magnetococcales bacterium]NGZ29010.1 aminotransferase class I/II-fold pyridoxal phosphate-dependent enzyme [Magnetococcales bacterium]
MSRSHYGSLVDKVREELVHRFLQSKQLPGSEEILTVLASEGKGKGEIPAAFYQFDQFPELLLSRMMVDHLNVADPFFKCHEGGAGAITQIQGRQLINFSNYNYLGLNGHPRVNQAALEAMQRYGTSASASRLVGGERPVHRQLEEALAEFYGVDDCVAMVSGHATNVNTIGHLFGPKDLIIHDHLIHNSILEGIKLSGAARRRFAHNDLVALDHMLGEIRGQFERVLVVAEGLYSMDGDVADLPGLIAIKKQHKCFLMVDEAHSLGVLGKNGGGIRDHFNMAGPEVDIWMGTLSKSLAGCGGFIAGSRSMIRLLKYSASGFVFSVGMAPPLAAASLEALRILQEEPQRVQRLHTLSNLFLKRAREKGIDTGLSQGFSIIPTLVGNSLKAVRLSNQLFERGIHVHAIAYPVVEEQAARLRFFVSSQHEESQIEAAVTTLAEVLA